MKERKIGATKLVLKQGDITREKVDVIVNAANSSLMGGGGVDGAIHQSGGPAILEECKKILEEKGKCPTGETVITTGGNLPAKYVIHTVGPIWSGGSKQEEILLANCYSNSLRLAYEYQCKTIAFPSISTGAYRFPVERAAKIALRTLIEEIPRYDFTEVRFILFTQDTFNIYSNTLEKV